MTAHSSVRSFLGLGKLNANNLRAAKVPRTVFSGVHSLDFKPTRKKVPLGSSRRPDVDEFALDESDTQVTGEIEGSTEGAIGLLANSLLGVVPTVTQQGGSAAYLAEWVGVGDTTPNAARLTGEKRLGTVNVSELCNFVVEQLQFKFDQAGFNRWVFNGPGSSWEYLATPSTPTFPTMGTLLSRRMGTITVDSVATLPVLGGSWTIKRPRIGNDYDHTSTERRDADYKGELEATFELEVLTEDASWLRRYLGGSTVTAPASTEAYFGANIKYERPDVIASTYKHGVTLDLPRMSLTGPESLPVNAKDELTQKISGSATYNTGTSRSLTLDILSTLTAI